MVPGALLERVCFGAQVRLEVEKWAGVVAGSETQMFYTYSAWDPGVHGSLHSRQSSRSVFHLVLSLSSSVLTAKLEEHPQGDGSWVPGLRTECVAWGMVASDSATKAFSCLRGFIFRHLCPNFLAPDCFTSWLVLTSSL